MVVRELLHQANHIVECPLGLAPGLTQSPQPGYINVCMTNRVDNGVEWRAGFFDSGFESLRSGFNTSVEFLVSQWVSCIEDIEGFIEHIEQIMLGWNIVIEIVCCFECDTGDR